MLFACLLLNLDASAVCGLLLIVSLNHYRPVPLPSWITVTFYECRYLLHSISSQISILVAGLQRLEGHQRHPQLPLPPVVPTGPPAVPPVPTVPEVLPPLPPPSMPAPTSPKASSARPTFTSMPITLVATSTNLAEAADLIEPVSDSASRERNRRRRSRRREAHRYRSRSRSHRRRPLARRGPVLTSDHRGAAPKAPPAVKAMPACRPSGLTRGR